MYGVVIDETRCTGCGLCAQDCRAGVLSVRSGIVRHENTCMLCGHCVAICPAGAVSIPSYDMSDVRPVSAPLDAHAYLQAMRQRRSVRTYTNEPVTDDMLAQMFEAARYVPTAVNAQDMAITMFQDELPALKARFWSSIPGIIKVMREKNADCADTFERAQSDHARDSRNDMFFYNAPCLLVFSARNALSAACAAQSAETMAYALGLGALYEGYLLGALECAPDLYAMISPDGRSPAVCMLVGHPAVRYTRTAPRAPAQVFMPKV